MKSFLVFASFVVWAALAHHLPEGEKEKLKLIHESCQDYPASHVDEDLLKKLADNVDNPHIGSHMLCMSIGAGLQNKSGDLDKEVIKSKIALVTHDQTKVGGLLKKCAVEKASPEKTAVMLWLCFFQNGIHYYYEL